MRGGPWFALLAQELRLAARHPGDSLAAVLFFVLVAALFPFGSGPAPEALARLAPGALVASALLAALLLAQVHAIASLWIPPVWAETLVYGVMLLVLVVRPAGLFRRMGEA